jgi:hypothetical protein
MSEFFSKELREGLAGAQIAGARKKSRLRVESGSGSFPVLRFWPDGLSIEAEHTTHLRGLVDVYDGAKHIFQCLIMASEVADNELICTFKRATAVLDRAALDYVRSETAPTGYLTKQ